MDKAYVTWIWVATAGAFVGLFIKPRAMVVPAIVLFILAVAGLAVSAALSHTSATWFFGVAAMAIPVLGGVAVIGSVIGSAVRGAVNRSINK